jgi:hypothetical protein
VVGTPFTAWHIKSKSHHFISNVPYDSILSHLVSAIFIIMVHEKPTLLPLSTALFWAGVAFFWFLARSGSKRLTWLADEGKQPEVDEHNPS